MAAEKDVDIIKEPYNPLDPEVKLDPEFNKKVILKQYDDPDKKKSKANTSALQDDAINIPVIRLNNITLMDEQIDQLIIYYDDFLPSIHLSIKDTQNVIKICDAPGYDNEIDVVITCQINGYYKKISLLFYITEFKVYDEYISYDGIFKLQTMNTHVMKQIGSDKLNTYDMLQEIAKENKLGFAATKKCEDVQDKNYRLIRSKTYVDYIKEQIALSGLDEESIFDAWIDIFGYIVMVNVHYVMTEQVEPQNLTIYTMINGENDLNDDKMLASATRVQRTLTNNRINVASTNLHFEKYEKIINNNNVYDEGALNTNYYLLSPCEENTIETEQIQLIENSTDGENNSKDYEFSKSQFIGIEFGETPILMQTKVHKRFFDKLRSKRLQIELTKHNLGLERGTLINVLFKEYNTDVIKTFYPGEDVEESADGVINPLLTAIYYIDGMKFEYVTENHKIQQTLYLIRRSPDYNPINKSTGPILPEGK